MIKAILTIDDVSSKNTPAIVDYLEEKKIPVIMFMVGQWAENRPEELIYALRHGIVVGNHSYTHPNFSKLSFEECKQEIDKNEEVLNRFYEQAVDLWRRQGIRVETGRFRTEMQVSLTNDGPVTILLDSEKNF